MRRFCEGGDTTGHRDLHQHTQTVVRTRQDTVYSARPHGVAEVGALRAILEVPVPWATSPRDSCPQHIFPAANPGQRVADAMSPLNGTTTEHQLERLLGVAAGTRRTALGGTVGSHPICGGARPEKSPTPSTSAGNSGHRAITLPLSVALKTCCRPSIARGQYEIRNVCTCMANNTAVDLQHSASIMFT